MSLVPLPHVEVMVVVLLLLLLVIPQAIMMKTKVKEMEREMREMATEMNNKKRRWVNVSVWADMVVICVMKCVLPLPLK